VTGLLLTLALLSAFRFQHHLAIGQFGYVQNLDISYQTLTLATAGGVLVYDLQTHRPIRTYLTDAPVTHALTSPGNTETFFVTQGGLYKLTRGVSEPIYLGHVGQIDALGYSAEFLWIYKNHTYRRFLRSGGDLGPGTPPKNTRWTGTLNRISFDDRALTFLAPFFVYDPRLGNVDYTVAVRDRSMLYVGTWGLGVFVYDLRTWRKVDSVYFAVEPEEIWTLTPALDGGVWIGGTAGLTHWSPQNTLWSLSSTRRTDFGCLRILDLLDRPEGLWIGADCGLFRYHNDFLARFSTLIRLSGGITALAGTDTLLWLGSNGAWGVLKNRKKLLSYTFPTPATVYKILTGEQTVYFLTDLGLYVLKPDTDVLSFLHDTRNWLRSDVFAGTKWRDSLYVIGADGLVIWRDGDTVFRYLPTPYNPQGQRTYAVTVDSHAIYLGTQSGLYAYDRETRNWIRYGRSDGLDDEEVHALLIRGDTLFVGTRRGLVLLW